MFYVSFNSWDSQVSSYTPLQDRQISQILIQQKKLSFKICLSR